MNIYVFYTKTFQDNVFEKIVIWSYIISRELNIHLANIYQLQQCAHEDEIR